MGGSVEVFKGVTRNVPRQIMDPATGDAYGGPPRNPSPFLASDALAVKVWPGAALATVATPTAVWLDATGAATFQIDVAPSDTASLAAGDYRFLVTATRAGSGTGKVDSGVFKLLAAPGTGSTDLAFTTYADLLLYCPWIGDLLSGADEVGFAVQQTRATNALIDCLVAQVDWGNMRPTLGQPGFGPLSMGMSSSRSNYWLREQLIPLVPLSTPPANLPDRLSTPANLIDPTVSTALLLYPAVKEVCANWAISYVLRTQIGTNANREWHAMAAQYRREGDAVYRRTDFGIDLSNPQTGWPATTVRGSGGSVR